MCGTNATEPSTEADAPAESKLARGRYQANLSFSAKGDSAVLTAIFFVLFDFNKKFSFLYFWLIFCLNFCCLFQYMRLECLFCGRFRAFCLNFSKIFPKIFINLILIFFVQLLIMMSKYVIISKNSATFYINNINALSLWCVKVWHRVSDL